MKLNNNITKYLNEKLALSSDKLDTLFESLYPEIKKIAHIQLNKINTTNTMSATVLLNECYIKFKEQKTLFKDKQHFFSLTSKCMRFYLIDLYRSRISQKNKGIMVEFDDQITGEDPFQIDLIALDMAINQLEEIDEKLANVVELRFFGGLTLDEIAQLSGSNINAIYKEWLLAKSILVNLIGEQQESEQ